jgi:hypothetical protein
MRRVRTAILLFAAIAAAAPARAADFALRWRLEKGEVLRYRMVAEQKTTHGAQNGEPVETSQRTRIVWRLAVREIDRAGNARIDCRYEEVAVDLDQLVLGHIAWDSTKKEDLASGDDPAVRPFAELVGQQFSFSLAPDGTVREVAGFDRIVKAMLSGLEDNPIAVAALSSGYGEDAVRAALERSFAVVPAASAVPENARWRRESEQSVPVLGTIRYETDFAIEGVKRPEGGGPGLFRIGANVRLSAVPPAAPGEEGAAQGFERWLGVVFEGGSGSAAISFAERGYLEKSETRLEMKLRTSAKPPVAPAEGPGAAAIEAVVRETVTVERLP